MSFALGHTRPPKIKVSHHAKPGKRFPETAYRGDGRVGATMHRLRNLHAGRYATRA